MELLFSLASTNRRDTAQAQLFYHMAGVKKDDVWTQFYPPLDK
jgi:hypothetical protein